MNAGDTKHQEKTKFHIIHCVITYLSNQGFLRRGPPSWDTEDLFLELDSITIRIELHGILSGRVQIYAFQHFLIKEWINRQHKKHSHGRASTLLFKDWAVKENCTLSP